MANDSPSGGRRSQAVPRHIGSVIEDWLKSIEPGPGEARLTFGMLSAEDRGEVEEPGTA
jgi:hypothetical protein